MQVIKPFDWTFSTDYKGTLKGGSPFNSTTESINVQKLKEREEILFFDELTFYEDELGDNGVSLYSAKVRVMPSCFFILLRFFLR